jgi:hypothetical protein
MMKRRGQSSMEYIALVTILIGAFIATGTYFKRGVQGRWRAAVDELGDQYDPGDVDTNILHRLSSLTFTQVQAIQESDGIRTKRSDQSNTIETKSGLTRVLPAP